MDRHCFDADLEPHSNFRFDAEPDLDPGWHQMPINLRIADPTRILHMLENGE
jgi:hypothetical protein